MIFFWICYLNCNDSYFTILYLIWKLLMWTCRETSILSRQGHHATFPFTASNFKLCFFSYFYKVLNAFGANIKVTKRQQQNVIIQQLFTILLLVLISIVHLTITIAYQQSAILIQSNSQTFTKYKYCSQFAYCLDFSKVASSRGNREIGIYGNFYKWSENATLIIWQIVVVKFCLSRSKNWPVWFQ